MEDAMKTINSILWLILAVVFATSACTETRTVRKNATVTRPAIYSDISTDVQAKEAIENWDQRVLGLKKTAVDTTSEDRFKSLDRKISKLDSELKDARQEYFDLKVAKPSDRQKHVDKINKKLSDMGDIFHSVAE